MSFKTLAKWQTAEWSCVSDGRRISGIITFPDQRDFVAAGCEVTVNAIIRNVEFAIAVPAHMHVRLVPRYVFDLCIELRPMQALSLLVPEPFRISNRGGVHFPVLFQGQIGLGYEVGRGSVYRGLIYFR